MVADHEQQKEAGTLFRISWAIAATFTLAMLVGILIVTRDLATTNNIFKDGVVQAETVNATSDDALTAADQLPPADSAIHQGLPHVVEVLGSLSRAQATLGTLGDQLDGLGVVLTGADPPLVGIIGGTKEVGGHLNAAVDPAASIVGLLDQADQSVVNLVPRLDETLARAQRIEAKLRLLLLIPDFGGAP